MNLNDIEAIFWGDQREQPARVRLARVVRALRDYIESYEMDCDVSGSEVLDRVLNEETKHEG